MSFDITASQALVALHDTAMISELFSVMSLALGVRVNSKTAPCDAIYPLMNMGLNKIAEFHFGVGAKQFVSLNDWSDSKTMPRARDALPQTARDSIGGSMSRLMLEGAENLELTVAPLQIRPGAFSEVPGVAIINYDGRKATHLPVPVNLSKLLEPESAISTERWRLANELQDKFGKELPLITGSEPESTITYQRRGDQIIVDVTCGKVHNIVDGIVEVDNNILHLEAIAQVLEFAGATLVSTPAADINPEYALSAEEKLAVLRTNFPDWGKW